MRRFSLSIGTLNLSVELLRMINSNLNMDYEEVENILIKDEIKYREYGQVVLESAIDFGWLTFDTRNNLCLAESLKSIDLEDETHLQRELLLLYITNVKPIWIRYLSKGINHAEDRISGEDVKQIFRELGLFPNSNYTTKDVVSWWSKIRVFSLSQKDQNLSKIGYEGELLSLEFEKKRTGKNPEYKALQSDNFGYDIRSIVSKSNLDPLHIEVKSSKNGAQSGSMFLSRNEFDKCIKYGDNYQFHLWDLSLVTPRILILPGKDIIPHIPIDSGNGIWKIVEIKFRNFDWESAIEYEEGFYGTKTI
tara:strand:- start:1788 stop:2705 length:918 start_codon:yes stop_codon:yes gene_type:complete